jgi:phosphoglucomutase
MDPVLGEELKALKNAIDENPGDNDIIDKIVDRFYRDLEFGTGGMRGILGAGPNRMNIYTVRRITQGLANHVNQKIGTDRGKSPSVAIGYDNRINSELFAFETARVLLANNISVLIYKELMPTPALSFAVRYYSCSAGVMITASHNGKEYNGYKVYDGEGEQSLPEEADAIAAIIDSLDIFEDTKTIAGDFKGTLSEKLAKLANTVEGIKGEGLKPELTVIPEDTVNKYIDSVLALSMGARDLSNISIVFTPLNGAGNKPVRRVLDAVGLKNVHVVKEQELPDGNFPTCPYPNPEKREALKLGLDLCQELSDTGNPPDLLLATDPDCDRLGIAVLHNGEYVQFTGNETGVVLLDFVLRSRSKNGSLPEKPVVVKTIVSTPLATALATDFGAEMINVLTGFKFIGEQITILKNQGDEHRYIFGFEESCGYMSGVHVRDKDAVNASLLLVELAAECKEQGKTVVDRLEEIYEKYGYYESSLLEFTMEGSSGMERIGHIMKTLRTRDAVNLFTVKTAETADYLLSERRITADSSKSVINLPKSDVLEYVLDDGGSIIVRPSGTEPKLKIYLAAKGNSRELAAEKTALLKNEVGNLIEGI